MRLSRELRLKSEFVLFILILFRLTLAAGLLANAAPGMTSLSAPAPLASSATAASALRLKGAAHFVAIHRAREGQCHGTACLYLHAKRNVVSRDTSSQLRGTS